MSDRWSAFCVVGMGGHARTKLLPAIAANGQRLIGIVSRSGRFGVGEGAVYPDVKAALDALPTGTAFILSSPPQAHFAQACVLLEAGRDVIVEKPAFVSRAEAAEAARLARKTGALLVEGFMHRQTLLYRRFMQTYRDRRSQVNALEVRFLIPAVPEGTFRAGDEIEASLLLDMGCYIVDLAAELGFPLSDLELTEVIAPGEPTRERYTLVGQDGNVALSASFGIASNYCNQASLAIGGEIFRFAPFFYGRSGPRTIERVAEGRTSREEVAERNAFEAMLDVSPRTWRAEQPESLRRMIAAAGRLDELGRDLARRRARTARRTP